MSNLQLGSDLMKTLPDSYPFYIIADSSRAKITTILVETVKFSDCTIFSRVESTYDITEANQPTSCGCFVICLISCIKIVVQDIFYPIYLNSCEEGKKD